MSLRGVIQIFFTGQQKLLMLIVTQLCFHLMTTQSSLMVFVMEPVSGVTKPGPGPRCQQSSHAHRISNRVVEKDNFTKQAIETLKTAHIFGSETAIFPFVIVKSLQNDRLAA